MKKINVVCAIIKKEDKIFSCARGYGEYKGKWEFPGGKVESGETNEAAIKREIKEELDTDIAVDEHIATIEHDYRDFHLSMDCYLCHIVDGRLTLLEASDSRWLTYDELDTVDWLEADKKAVEILKKTNKAVIKH